MAGGAVGGDGAAEIGRGMTRRATDRGMAAAEREPGPLVIEGDFRPACRRMTDAAAGVAHPVRRRLQRNGKRRRRREALPEGAGAGSGGTSRSEGGDDQERVPHGANPRKAPRWTSTWQSSQAVGIPR